MGGWGEGEWVGGGRVSGWVEGEGPSLPYNNLPMSLQAWLRWTTTASWQGRSLSGWGLVCRRYPPL